MQPCALCQVPSSFSLKLISATQQQQQQQVLCLFLPMITLMHNCISDGCRNSPKLLIMQHASREWTTGLCTNRMISTHIDDQCVSHKFASKRVTDPQCQLSRKKCVTFFQADKISIEQTDCALRLNIPLHCSLVKIPIGYNCLKFFAFFYSI